MALSNPVVLTNVTRFRPLSFRGHARSPSRSPIRKSQFLAKEIDPFLSNLSPDSTLKALQATSTIAEDGSSQDALAKSISDATPEEREIGIRAAVAAQKIKQWRDELEAWLWPSKKDRTWGAGFLPPMRLSFPASTTVQSTHLGFLPTELVQVYQDRIEDIRDGIEALELEEIKDHIFSAHVTHTKAGVPAKSEESSPITPTFAKMRDFTALITATVVQALPDMAHLNLLLDTWDIRLLILRQIPDIDTSTKVVRLAIEVARSQLGDMKAGQVLGQVEYDMSKAQLSAQVAALGSKIDKLLDLLEEQEDTLPQEWLDALEVIESEYAAWVVEAEHIVVSRTLNAQDSSVPKELEPEPKPEPESVLEPAEEQRGAESRLITKASLEQTEPVQPSIATANESITESDPIAQLPRSEDSKFPLGRALPPSTMYIRKPTLSIEPTGHGHRRGVSEISVAESALSGMSDISSAEIVDVRKTQVLASPKISLVDNPFRMSRDISSWLSPSNNLDGESSTRPNTLQRASTASIQVISKADIRPVTVCRSQSFDLLRRSEYFPPDTPSQALMKLTGSEAEHSSMDRENNGSDQGETDSLYVQDTEPVSKHPSLMVAPLVTRTDRGNETDTVPPIVPKRSSRRLVARHSSGDTAASPSPEPAEPRTPTDHEFDQPAITITTTSPSFRANRESRGESLEDKIKEILTSMPTKIKLSNASHEAPGAAITSQPPTRSSTPLPSLTISPAKSDRPSRTAAPGDVRLFHLTRAGQGKDAPPVKLFVRAVGENGERVMVRVGGGWADLAEYLREYSLHHRHRGLATGRLEVADLTTHTTTSTVPPIRSVSPHINSTSPVQQSSKRRFSLGSLSGRGVMKTRRNSQSTTLAPENYVALEGGKAPPVPAIPDAYSTHMSSTTTTTTTTISGDSTSTHVTKGPYYTPLGAAGPKSGSRRARASDIGAQNESWVAGMVGKARAVSGGSMTVQSPTTTTRTTITSNMTPASRKVSSRTVMSPVKSNSLAAPPAPPSQPSPVPPRPKSRMSLADVSGIRRVFLRRKSER